MNYNFNGQVPFLYFDSFENSGLIRHAFSTRMGGVSKGFLSELNLGFEKGDDPENVSENYRRMAASLGVSSDDMVMSRLEHGTTVRRVYAADKGKGITIDTDFDFCDGLITDEPGVMLVCRYADCTPLFFLDPVHKAIGLSHSGWRGTAGRMAAATVKRMTEEFDTQPGDVIAAIGPAICGKCFEVENDVAQVFRANFPEIADDIIKVKSDVKFTVDLPACNRYAMIEAGIKPENIEMSGLCTCCNPSLLFSHRATGGKRGDLAGFLMLTEE